MSKSIALALAVLGLVLASSCASDPDDGEALGSAAEWLPLEIGRSWTWEVSEAQNRTTIAYTILGGDVRSLGAEAAVDFNQAYGTLPGWESPTEKSIFALAASGPHIFYFDAGSWSLQFDPPLPLFPFPLRIGAEWSWEGARRFEDETRTTRVHSILEALETIACSKGLLECLRIRHRHDDGVEIVNHYARGVGLVSSIMTGKGPRRSVKLR